MWKRFSGRLRCPVCKASLELHSFEELRPEIAPPHLAHARQQGIDDDGFGCYVNSGVLCCHTCRVWYPVSHGMPVLLPYRTPVMEEFAQDWPAPLSELPVRYEFPSKEPVPGERFVMSSFSTEWLSYDFDGVIWEMNYEDHERRFRAELGDYAPKSSQGGFLEVGCGIGITTEMAQRNFGVDAVGVDLSLAAMRAAVHYRGNPFLHFVQASAFYLPFQRSSFRTVYSRGVLHHTYSTAQAFKNVAEFCAPGGSIYLWVYGPGSIDETLFRRIAYLFERPVRRVISRNASGVAANLILGPMSLAYLAFNRGRRLMDPSIQPYNYRRALHAARDRFSPEFAHRHDHGEVSRWFADARLTDMEVVNWRDMPSADHDDYRRNTGVRGRRPAAAPA